MVIAHGSATSSTYRSALRREAAHLVLPLLAFVALLGVVLTGGPTEVDTWLAGRIQSIPWGAFAAIPRLGSDIGGGVYGAVAIPALTGAFLLWRRQWRLLALLGAVVVLHYVLISPKLFITAYRPSPAFGVEGAGGLESFPSGHVQWAASFYGFLAYFLIGLQPRLRWPIIAGYVLVVAGTMLGRIELGRHWPIDTVAGVLAGVIALRLVILAERWLARRHSRPAPAASQIPERQ
ncbi:MAG: phosphatase PAP2 family protein [Dehalococcoidia bacterium]